MSIIARKPWRSLINSEFMYFVLPTPWVTCSLHLCHAKRNWLGFFLFVWLVGYGFSYLFLDWGQLLVSSTHISILLGKALTRHLFLKVKLEIFHIFWFFYFFLFFYCSCIQRSIRIVWNAVCSLCTVSLWTMRFMNW